MKNEIWFQFEKKASNYSLSLQNFLNFFNVFLWICTNDCNTFKATLDDADKLFDKISILLK